MAREVLKDPQYFADQIQVPVDLVIGVRNLWIALTSSLPIDPDKYDAYAQKVDDLYQEHCGWYPQCPGLHKGIKHGADILRMIPPNLSSGLLSEEPAEAANKDVKSFQIDHARQSSLKLRNLDTFNREGAFITTLNLLYDKFDKFRLVMGRVRKKSGSGIPQI